MDKYYWFTEKGTGNDRMEAGKMKKKVNYICEEALKEILKFLIKLMFDGKLNGNN